MCFQLQTITTWLEVYAICLAERYCTREILSSGLSHNFLGAKDRPAPDLVNSFAVNHCICICEYVFFDSHCNRVLSGGMSWILSMAPNIYPNVDGEVAYAVNPITGLPMVTFKSSLNASIPNTVTLTLLRDVLFDTLM